MPMNYSPVNFDEPDFEKYPDFGKAQVHQVVIEAGNCLYLPANWWHRVTSSPEETVAVSHWFKAHSLVTDLVHAFALYYE